MQVMLEPMFLDGGERGGGSSYLAPEAEAIRSAAFAALGLRETTVVPVCVSPEAEAVESSAVKSETTPPGGELPDMGEGSVQTTEAPYDLLAHARQMLVAYRQQQQARATANRAEEAWQIVRYSSATPGEEVKRANRTRLAARRAFDKAWDEYLDSAQKLCRAAGHVIGQEPSEAAVRSLG